MTKTRKNIKKKEKVAIKVEGVSKSFRIPHEKHNTLKQTTLNIFNKRSYEVFAALHDIGFEIKKGEFFGIIGKNGSGKSTLLKMLAGIYTPDKGEITINGKLSPFLELGVGFNPELTARENLFLGGAVLGLTREEISKKFDQIIEFAELEEFVDLKFKNFSSGMQVRLAFALAINAHAEILLMDEVLAVGDNNFQAKCLSEFNKYRRQGKTVVLVTHDISTVQKYCDRAMLLRNGEIVKIGKADDVGNEYIHQNMSDEENRIIKNEKEPNKIAVENNQEKNAKKAKITRVELLNDKGEPVDVVKTHDKIEIKIWLKELEKTKKAYNIGISIEEENGNYLFGYNTEMDAYKWDIDKGYISVIFPNFPLINGTFAMNVTVVNKKTEELYDFKPRIKLFRVFSFKNEKLYKGCVSVEHYWNQ